MTIQEELRGIRLSLEAINKRLDGQVVRQTVPLAEAAKMLSVGLTTLKAMIRRRELRPVMVGKRRMIPTAQLVRVATETGAPMLKTSLARRAVAMADAAAIRSLAKRRH